MIPASLTSAAKHPLLGLIGNTPLLPIPHRYSPKVLAFAKLEYQNPGGSVKDRAAKAIVLDALAKGALQDKTLIDATSGNTGIAYAMIGSALGIPVALALPENASPERKRILAAYGVELHLTSPMEGTDGAQRFVADFMKERGDRYVWADQYNNPNNWRAHYDGTGPEIWRQTEGRVTHFVAGLGTTGTFVGTARFLSPHGVRCIAVQPDNPMHGLEGWKHLPTAKVPGIYDASVAHEQMEIGTEDGFAYAIAAARYLGLLISPSAAANLCALLRVVERLDEGTAVTVFPDNAFKYLHDRFWENPTYRIANPFVAAGRL